MKWINSFIILLLFGISCTSGTMKTIENFFVKKNCNKGILISCIKCACIIQELNKIATSNPGLLQGYQVYGDPACLTEFIIKDKIFPLQQSSIDSISTEFYNLVIYNNGKLTMVKTENVAKMKKYLE
jgi:hypothetical protein